MGDSNMPPNFPCPYRTNRKCTLNKRIDADCDLCLSGQLVDAVELLTSAVMSISIDITESNIKKVMKDERRK